MAISRGVCAALVAVMLAATAQAAIIGTATLQRQPPGNPFASPDAALGAPWVGYSLGLQSDGEIIAAVDVTINGQLHQRWTPGEDENGDPVDLPTANSANQTNGDSHLRAVTGALFGAGPFEDNSKVGSPLANTPTAVYGIGTTLSGAWGIPLASQGTTANLAYIVIPENSKPSIDIRVKVAGQDGGILADLPASAFPGFGQPTNATPIVGDKMVDWFSQNPPAANSDSLSLTDDGPPGVWSIDSFVSPNGNAPSIDPNTGVFTWIGNGSPEGVYPAVLKYTDGGGLSDVGTLTIKWHIPEPSTLALFGLALVGFAGCRRK